MAPELIFGTASFGMEMTEFQDTESVRKLLEQARSLGITHLDTAARYPPLSPGRSEELLGLAHDVSGAFKVDTKVLASTSNPDGSGELSREAIAQSVDASLKRLHRDSVDVLYVHRADPKTPLEEQIQGFAEQIRLGHCRAWSLSGSQPDVVERMLDLCEENGWPKPEVYQGSYSIIARGCETRLFPILRKHGVAFNAIQILGAGFLTGNAANNKAEGTRFSADHPLGKAAASIFCRDATMAAMRAFDASVRAKGLTPIEVALRWIAHHSQLRDGEDAIVLGASKTRQLTETVVMMNKGRLSEDVLMLVDELWESVKGEMGQRLY